MQILPQFDPWGQVGQQMGTGIGNYLMQAADRSRFRQNLSAAQQLMGQNPSPTEMLFGLLQASEGNPAFLQTVSEIYPHLRQEQKRPAGTPLNFFGGGQARGGQRLPDGQMANRPPRENRQYMTPSGQPQQGPAYNAQMYEDTTGSVGGAQPGSDSVDQRIRRGPPSSVTNVQPMEDYEGGQAGAELQGGLTPNLYNFTPQQQEDLTNQIIAQTGDIAQAGQLASQIREGINATNQINLDKFKAERVVDAEQRAFLDNKLKSLGYFSHNGTDLDPYLTTRAYEEWNKAASNPNLKNDTQRWNVVKDNITRYRNIENQMLKGSGSPYWWENPKEKFDSASRANNAYRKTMNVIDPDTGLADPLKVDRMIDLNKRQGWPDDAAKELALPTSRESNAVIAKAPSMYSVKIPPGWENHAQDYEKYKIQDPKKREGILTQVASDLVKSIQPNDSLTVIRRKLYNNHGYNEQDFRTILEKMEGMGWRPKPFQQREEGDLNMSLRTSLGEIISGYSLGNLFKQPRYVK